MISTRKIASHCLLLLVATFGLSGCDDDKGPAKPQHGPAISTNDLYNALDGLYYDSNPFITKVGAFVHFKTTHEIAGGQVRIHSADTGHTVVNRVESECFIIFHIVEKRFTHNQDGTSEMLKRELELPLQTSASGACAQTATDARAASISKFIQSSVKPAEDGGPSLVTFHNLRSWETRGPAPKAVRERPQDDPNCLGIPNCELRYRHVSFDLVDRSENPDGEVIHLEFVASPDIPQTSGFNMGPLFAYLPGLFKSCVTQMASLGGDAGKTLVTECQEVVDFTYELPPTP